MSSSVPDEVGPLIEEAGEFPASVAAIREAVKRLEDDPVRFAELKASIDEAVAELERGEGNPFDFAEIKRKVRELTSRASQVNEEPPMSVSIPTEFGPFVDQLIASGAYPSAEAVVSDALLQLRERRGRLEELKASLREAQEEIERGEGLPFDVEEILAEGRRMYAARHGG